MLVNTRELMEFYELRSTVSLQANLSSRLPTGKIPFLIFFVPQKLKNMLSLSLCYIVRYVIMDFNRFQEWCQNKGFVVKLPSGYSKLINLEVSSFESFKGIFNLCMLFFYEELYKQRENEKEEALNNCIKNFKNSPTILYPADGSTIEEISIKDLINKKIILDENFEAELIIDIDKIPTSEYESNTVVNSKELLGQSYAVIFIEKIKTAVAEKLAEIRALSSDIEEPVDVVL